MKRTSLPIALFLLAVPVATGNELATPARIIPRDAGHLSVFYDALAPNRPIAGIAELGQRRIPSGVEAGWRPYSDGYWVNREDRWAWVSDWDWGWAPVHYGRWVFHTGYGWSWLPGTVWAPTWVAWRSGPGYIGWAALPPEAGSPVGIGLAAFDIERFVEPHAFCFVDEHGSTDPHLRQVIELPARNETTVRNTTPITNYNMPNNRVFNQDVEVAGIEQARGDKVVVRRIVEANSLAEAWGQERQIDLVMYRPKSWPAQQNPAELKKGRQQP
jgi:hypothetical protein